MAIAYQYQEYRHILSSISFVTETALSLQLENSGHMAT